MKVHNLLGTLAASLLAFAGAAAAHCDTMDGPVVTDAKAALAAGDVTPVLKWVQPAYEAEVAEAFKETLAVRDLGPEGRDLADRYFFETLVRLHRAGEGEPFTGLKPGGTDPGRAVAAADAALAAGSADALVKLITETVANGINERFREAFTAKKTVGKDVAAGRAFVAAYVEYVHYVERLYDGALGAGGHSGDASAESHDAH